MVHMRLDQAAAFDPAFSIHDQVVALDTGLDPAGLEPGLGRGEAVALLHLELREAFHARLSFREGREAGEHRIFVDHRGRTLGRHAHSLEPARPDAEIGGRLAAFMAKIEELDASPHLPHGLDEAAPRRVHQHAFDGDVGAFRDQSSGDEEGGGARIARHGNRGAMKLGIAANGDGSALTPLVGDKLGAEIAKHAFGVVARGQRLDHGGAAWGMHAGEKDGRLHLRRRHRQLVDDGDEVLGAANPQRQSGSRLLDLKPHQVERLEHPTHRPSAQRCIAGELDLDGIAGDGAQHEAAARSGIAEVERRARRKQAAHALSGHLDRPVRAPHLSAERGNSLGRRHHVLGLEQPGDAGSPRGQRPEDQGAMGNRLVARHARPPGKACGAA